MILGIYGAGGLGREVLELVHEIQAEKRRWSDVVFIDDFGKNKTVHDVPTVPFSDFSVQFPPEKAEIVIATGEPEVRKILWNKIRQKKYTSPVIIHPSVSIPSTTVIGAGTIIGRNVNVSCDIVLGENIYVQPTSSFGHDTKVGAHSVISTFASIAGGCAIGECVYIAMCVPVKERCSVGSNTIVGMGSVVLRDIPGEMIALGNPARPIRRNENHRVFGE